MKKIISIITILIFNSVIIFAQEKCECCTYSSIDNLELFEVFFNPEIISKVKIKQATIYTTEKFNNIETRYLQTKFIFNKQGYVIKRKWYNCGGKPHSLYTYERNESNQITKITFSYLDSNEVVSDYMPPKITDYHYNKDGKLVHIKERDYHGNILADSLSHYTIFKYDKDGNIIQQVRHFYWDGLDSGSKHDYKYTRIKYIDGGQEAQSEIFISNELWLTSTTKFNEQQKKIYKEDFNVMLNSMAYKINYKYNETGKLIFYKVVSSDGSGTECKDGGNFQEAYKYNEQSLLKIILHNFENVECEMNIDYK